MVLCAHFGHRGIARYRDFAAAAEVGALLSQITARNGDKVTGAQRVPVLLQRRAPSCSQVRRARIGKLQAR
jgi:hypothetical protein